MSIVPRSRFLILAMLAAVLSGCGRGGPGPAVDAGWLAGLEQVRSAIASSTGFSPASIEVMASPAHLRISISDARLAQADQAAREDAATAVMTAAERSLAENARFSSVQQVSVAIVHPAAAASEHTEDVVDFRKGPDERFSKHSTCSEAWRTARNYELNSSSYTPTQLANPDTKRCLAKPRGWVITPCRI